MLSTEPPAPVMYEQPAPYNVAWALVTISTRVASRYGFYTHGTSYLNFWTPWPAIMYSTSPGCTFALPIHIQDKQYHYRHQLRLTEKRNLTLRRSSIQDTLDEEETGNYSTLLSDQQASLSNNGSPKDYTHRPTDKGSWIARGPKPTHSQTTDVCNASSETASGLSTEAPHTTGSA
ncbi:hypothetical protein EX30DRAFT_375626 [Ascodesmis nigricans]|uniref:Uncharacterized protein n=1 Tax=Ascodesmis nigricans TaxID=341454 RepID=A0A4S2MPK6_9PEZI|nr:hypothetical protein EX30DRAFT_375626 [Ascodesmis nigricans]